MYVLKWLEPRCNGRLNEELSYLYVSWLIPCIPRLVLLVQIPELPINQGSCRPDRSPALADRPRRGEPTPLVSFNIPIPTTTKAPNVLHDGIPRRTQGAQGPTCLARSVFRVCPAS